MASKFQTPENRVLSNKEYMDLMLREDSRDNSNNDTVYEDPDEDFYKRLDQLITFTPGLTDEECAYRLQTTIGRLLRTIAAIKKNPNTFWGLGPYEKQGDGWFNKNKKVDTEKMINKIVKENIYLKKENNALKEEIKALKIQHDEKCNIIDGMIGYVPV